MFVTLDKSRLGARNGYRKISGICVGSWTGRMTDSEGEQVVTCQVTDRGMDETEAGIPLLSSLCCITKETNNMYLIKFLIPKIT